MMLKGRASQGESSTSSHVEYDQHRRHLDLIKRERLSAIFFGS